MREGRKQLMGAVGAIALTAGMVCVATSAQAAPSPTAGVVINEVYGGGGNSGATYKQDFVELVNTGTAPVKLDGWSVQYASAAQFAYQVTAPDREDQFLGVGREFPVGENPSLWSTLELRD